jgi:peptidyl-prolyl cis-trans isomerase D
MLQSIRDRLVGWMLWVVIGAVAVPFAFWGIESFRTDGNADPVVAKVGSEKITEGMLRSAYDQHYRRMQELMGDSFRPELIDKKDFRRRVLDGLIENESLRQQSAAAGYQIPDSVLLESVRAIPAFQDGGTFSAERYRERLGEQGSSPERFESRMRESLVLEQLRDGVISTAFVTEADVAANYRVAAQERFLSYVEFDVARYQAAIAVGDDQVKSRYEERKTLYMAPERIKLAYVELSLDKLPKAGSPGDEALKAIYEAEKATRFSTPEERQARHILISFGADKQAAKKRIEGLLAKIKTGADFSGLAKSESADTGSKNDGGSLGWVKRGQMVKGFEEALYAMRKGEVSEPVETEFGWHLIRLDDLRPAATRGYDDKTVQAELLDLFQKREGEKHFQEQQEKIEQLAFENPTALDAVAKALNLEVQTTDWFSRGGGAGIAANAAVIQAAFSDDLIKNSENSKPIALAPGNVVVVRKAEYEAPRQKTLEEVSEQIRAELKGEGARAKAKTEVAAALAEAAAGKSLADVAKAAGGEFKSVGLVKRNQPDVDRQILAMLFRMPRPEAQKPRLQQVDLAGGKVAIIALSDVKDAELSAADEAEARRSRAGLRDAYAGQELNAYRAQIRNAIKVSINEKAAEDVEEAAP